MLLPRDAISQTKDFLSAALFGTDKTLPTQRSEYFNAEP
jgi:hypothetical protein